MIGLAQVAVLLASSPVALFVEDARDLAPTEIRALIQDLSAAIERRIAESPRAAPLALGGTCIDRLRCFADVLALTDARALVAVRVLAVPSKIRLIAELRDGQLSMIRRAQVDLARDPGAWPASLDAAALALFPWSAGSPPDVGESLVQPAPERELVAQGVAPGRRWPWWLIGGGAVAGGIAVALGVENQSARDEGTQAGLPRERIEELRDTTRATGLGANVLFGVAAASVITGTIFLVLDE